MHEFRRFVLLVPAIIFALTLAVRAQDEPSLGDVARQTRQQKQQKDAESKAAAANAQNADAHNKDVQNKDVPNQGATGTDAAANPPAPKTQHVITNEDISSPFGATPQTAGTHASGSHSSDVKSPSEGSETAKASAETWGGQIQAQKNAISSLQAEITQLNDSIQFAPGNCVSGCVEWNERQKQKQDQVAAMKVQLEQLQQHLEEMQEAARQQGYGSSVYEP